MLAKPDWKAMTRAERSEALRPLVSQGLPASKIAAHFMNVTRNAVLGFLHRQNIALANSRPASTVAKMPPKQKPRPRPAPPRPIGNTASKPIPAPAPAPDPVAAVTFMEALDRRLCKWPLWDQFGPDAKCCGSQREGIGPYCRYHARLSVGAGTYGERDADRQLRKVLK